MTDPHHVKQVPAKLERDLGGAVLVVWKLPVRVNVYRNDKSPIGTVWTLLVIHDHHDRIHGFDLSGRGGLEAIQGFAVALADDMHALAVWPDDEGFERMVLDAMRKPEGSN